MVELLSNVMISATTKTLLSSAGVGKYFFFSGRSFHQAQKRMGWWMCAKLIPSSGLSAFPLLCTQEKNWTAHEGKQSNRGTMHPVWSNASVWYMHGGFCCGNTVHDHRQFKVGLAVKVLVLLMAPCHFEVTKTYFSIVPLERSWGPKYFITGYGSKPWFPHH